MRWVGAVRMGAPGYAWMRADGRVQAGLRMVTRAGYLSECWAVTADGAEYGWEQVDRGLEMMADEDAAKLGLEEVGGGGCGKRRGLRRPGRSRLCRGVLGPWGSGTARDGAP